MRRKQHKMSPSLSHPIPRLIRINEMIMLLGIDRTTLYRRVRKKQFPQPIKNGNRTLGWSEETYINWLKTPENNIY